MESTQSKPNAPSWRLFTTIVLCSALTTLLVTSLASQKISTSNEKQDLKQIVLERGSLKCAYVVYSPGVFKDSNSGLISGIAVDAATLLAEKLSVKIDWVEEAAWGTMIEGLHTGRYDMVVGEIWPTAARAKRVEFTDPMWYSVAGLYSRKDDNRFSDLESINKSSIRISVIDGEISTLVAKAKYPKAQLVALPQTAEVSQMILNVVTNKADLAIVTPYQASLFLKANPNSIKEVNVGQPLRYSSNTFLVPEGQSSFKAMINTAIEEMMNTGELDDILTKYEPSPGAFYRAAIPFERAKQE